MTSKETFQIIARIIAMYPSFKFGGEIDGMDIGNPLKFWHEQIGYMDFAKADKATIECIKECKYAPTAAEIIEKYNEIEKAEKTEYYAVKNEFERCRNYYPGSGSIDNGWPEFQERLKKAKSGMQVEAARYLANKVIGYVHECECNGTDPIDFAECIKTVAV